MGELLGTIWGRLIMLMGLAAVVTLGIVAFSGSKVTDTVSDIALLQGNARQQLGSTPNGYLNFTTANAATLISNGIVPSGMVRGGALTDKWGGAITLGSLNNGAQGVIHLTGVSSIKDCNRLVTTLGDYDSLLVGSTTFTPDNRPDGVTAAQACTGTVDVEIHFS
ncbi:type 4 pilus major pilin [Burkholderia gladioli]|uniref:type 4 pilus major pilin n=1 Tax=Burkholderia gladioli TaxID=28095 RepID=UPI00163DE684|nr:type 4 pilus major pilin [Burkholderia gladioli]